MISKSFHHQLRLSERQALVGPPESMREHVVAASKAMRYGDWRLCRQHLINEKMNAKVWNLFHNAEKVKALITRYANSLYSQPDYFNAVRLPLLLY